MDKLVNIIKFGLMFCYYSLYVINSAMIVLLVTYGIELLIYGHIEKGFYWFQIPIGILLAYYLIITDKE